ncbi:MAG: hypothetical protein U0Q18_25335 [Bryobacteraceae bacterium]
MAVVVTYLYPVNGTVPPTAQQAAAVNMVVAQVAWGDTDTSALVTHNWSVAQPNVPNAVSGTPPTYTGALGAVTSIPVVLTPLDGTSAGTVAATVSYTVTNSVVVTVKKGSTAGTNGTVTVTLLRPHTLIM